MNNFDDCYHNRFFKWIKIKFFNFRWILFDNFGKANDEQAQQSHHADGVDDNDGMLIGVVWLDE